MDGAEQVANSESNETKVTESSVVDNAVPSIPSQPVEVSGANGQEGVITQEVHPSAVEVVTQAKVQETTGVASSENIRAENVKSEVVQTAAVVEETADPFQEGEPLKDVQPGTPGVDRSATMAAFEIKKQQQLEEKRLEAERLQKEQEAIAFEKARILKEKVEREAAEKKRLEEEELQRKELERQEKLRKQQEQMERFEREKQEAAKRAEEEELKRQELERQEKLRKQQEKMERFEREKQEALRLKELEEARIKKEQEEQAFEKARILKEKVELEAEQKRQEELRLQREAELERVQKLSKQQNALEKFEEEQRFKKMSDEEKKAYLAKKEEEARIAEEKRIAQEKAEKEEAERVAREAEEKARKEAEEKARKEAEERAKIEAEEKARRDAEEQARLALLAAETKRESIGTSVVTQSTGVVPSAAQVEEDKKMQELNRIAEQQVFQLHKELSDKERIAEEVQLLAELETDKMMKEAERRLTLKSLGQLPDGSEVSKPADTSVAPSSVPAPAAVEKEQPTSFAQPPVESAGCANTDVFLRELISNSADALDKIRFQSLTNKAELETNEELKIYISSDKSGTEEFLKNLEKQNLTDPGLIGQFGVGFYSSFLVADRVTVISKNNKDDQYVWSSDSQSNFKITKDPRGNTLGRGTEIILHLKKDAAEFLETEKLKEIIQKHSEFVNFPIYLYVEKTIEEAVEDTDVPGEDVEDVTEEEKKPKTVSKTVQEWDLVNENKPIWTRSPSDVTDEEYKSFFKAHFKEFSDPIAHSHFKLEGENEFTGLLFIPSSPPQKFLQPDAPQLKNVQLFVKRVFITDELSDFLPKWLGFLKVLIDTDDIPLNVSRETLQNHAFLKIIKNKIISKALDLLIQLSEDDKEKFKLIHKEYKQAFRYGLYDAKTTHRKKLLKLLRFESSSKEYTSLQEYVDRMKEGQPQIYFSAGISLESAKASPLAEKLISKGYEVLYLSDSFEEYLTTTESLKQFNDLPLQNIQKPGLKLGTEDDETAAEETAIKEKYEPLTDWLKEKLEDKVSEVKVSFHLETAPLVVVPGSMGLSPSQEKMMVMQSSGKENYMLKFYLEQKRIMEINPTHPLVEKLLENVKEGNTDSIKHLPAALFEIYAIGSGYDVRNPTAFINTLETVFRDVLGVEQKPVEKEKAEEKQPESEHDEL
ncbi:hypothetical protein HK103_006495 [Boothiomyces macroporosus]|uniref:Uncharacterized protein n=1 Tax=Boothiomyces macroporosus TaxID=261099 RepID=A0AAD5UPU9_9FUNG|nr:hypothetical protein HK103_006495 [Boothiomyces macroporosus]